MMTISAAVCYTRFCQSRRFSHLARPVQFSFQRHPLNEEKDSREAFTFGFTETRRFLSSRRFVKMSSTAKTSND
jgi:hypothetical protein